MYSRNRNGSAEERYAKNIPPVYGGSRFYRGTAGGGIAVQYEAKPRETVPQEAACEVADVPEISPADVPESVCAPKVSPAPCVQDVCQPIAEEKADPPCAKQEKAGGLLQSFLSGEQEELLLIALLLLFCGEQERCVDMIVILVLLLIVR